MEYNSRAIEEKWQKKWRADKTYRVEENDKPKYYVLDMFPYPSGAGLHVGHPLGYIASDIFARYKTHNGFNVLHPMGYDSFGLPAEQYAIQTGQHPAVTTEKNVARYREQLDRIGFCYDWDREVRTSNPDYYRWTQWIFKLIYNSWYNLDTDKAEPIETLIQKFEKNGTYEVNASIQENWWKEVDYEKYAFHFGEHFSGDFTATDWTSMTEEQQQVILLHYRLTYLKETMVNWCPELGTVLANDEVKDGLSERGGHPVVQKNMMQWSMRISAYADRLLQGLENVDWTDAIKDQQRNWIGKSEGASVTFRVSTPSGVEGRGIEVFTTRPDTIFGVSFMVLAPEHPLVMQICSEDQRAAVEDYIAETAKKSERDRQADVKNISGCFTGAYAQHPFTGEPIPIWIADYVLAGYGTGAVMAVPSGDERDYAFAKYFDLPIPNVFDADISEQACSDKAAILANSDFLNGMTGLEAIPMAIAAIEEKGIGQGKVNYRLRDAVFSRQRYWGEPFPVYYRNDVPYLVEEDLVELPPVDKYLPTEEGEPPLARAEKQDWQVFHGERMDHNTMPGWAGSSWYYLRYMDPNNEQEFCAKEKSDYWGQVDLYMGGAEHAVGHLLYSRFWCKILHDHGHIAFDEPFKKMINQGMIGGVIEYLLLKKEKTDGNAHFMCRHLATREGLDNFIPIAVRTDLVSDYGSPESYMTSEGLNAFAEWMPTYKDAIYECGQGTLRLGKFESKGGEGSWLVTKSEQGKMGKRYHNTVDPTVICDQYGADTLRCYEMFLGPIEQHKPWDTNGITGVHNFLKKLSRLFNEVSEEAPSKASEKTIHKTIKKVTEDIERYSFNTVVSALMICVNELGEQKCSSRSVLQYLPVLLSPYAPHLAEELWEKLGNEGSVTKADWPVYDESKMQDDAYAYPISFNGKMRFKMEFPMTATPKEIEEAVLAAEDSAKYLEGKTPKKVIVVPKKIVNVVV